MREELIQQFATRLQVAIHDSDNYILLPHEAAVDIVRIIVEIIDTAREPSSD